MSQMEPIGVLCAKPYERDAFFKALRETSTAHMHASISEEDLLQDGPLHSVTYFQSLNDWYVVAVLRQQGPVAAALGASYFVRQYKLSAIGMTGCCGGLQRLSTAQVHEQPPKGTNVVHVLERSALFECGRVDESGTAKTGYRGSFGSMTSLTAEVHAATSNFLSKQVTGELDIRLSQFFTASQVREDVGDVIERVAPNSGENVCVEMEAFSVMSAAEQCKIPCQMVVKGVSDTQFINRQQNDDVGDSGAGDREPVDVDQNAAALASEPERNVAHQPALKKARVGELGGTKAERAANRELASYNAAVVFLDFTIYLKKKKIRLARPASGSSSSSSAHPAPVCAQAGLPRGSIIGSAVNSSGISNSFHG